MSDGMTDMRSQPDEKAGIPTAETVAKTVHLRVPGEHAELSASAARSFAKTLIQCANDVDAWIVRKAEEETQRKRNRLAAIRAEAAALERDLGIGPSL